MLHIVYNADDNYLMPTLVSAASAAYHAADPSMLVIDVLDCGIERSHWDGMKGRLLHRFPRLGGLFLHHVDMDEFREFRDWRGSRATYARILTPEVLADTDMCLFVDGDTLFVSDPLELLGKFDANYWIQGSVDTGAPGRKEMYESYGLTMPDDYVCAGFMLMNLRALRENDFSKKCIDFLSKYPVLLYVDQEAINYIAHGHMAQLDPEWGVFNAYGFSLVRRPKCIHYIIRSKPWQLGWCLHDMERAWFSYARKLLSLTWKDLPEASAGKYYWLVLKTFVRTIVQILLRRKKWMKGCYYEGRIWRQLYDQFPFYKNGQ